MADQLSPQQIHPSFQWHDIDTVLLDMDGTLLDGYFDDFFWEEYVPKVYAQSNGISQDQARKELLARYSKVAKTMQWSDLDYWSDQLGLDIPELKYKIDHLIQVHPYVIDFLQYVNSLGKELVLVTAAHSKALKLKLSRTSIGHYFQRIVTIGEIGAAKEQHIFWELLEKELLFDRKRTLLVDDNTNVLEAANRFGLGQLIYVARPSSRRPVRFSNHFPSIVYFKELLIS